MHAAQEASFAIDDAQESIEKAIKLLTDVPGSDGIAQQLRNVHQAMDAPKQWAWETHKQSRRPTSAA